jgi:iron complex outermembrane receptor protein
MLLNSAGPAIAQNRRDDLPEATEIIVTALKIDWVLGADTGIPLDRVPQSLQVVRAEELRDRGARSINDALLAVPSAEGGPSRATPFPTLTVTLRGFGARQIRNGVRQRFFEQVDPSALTNVERIEVIKGPSAVLYGQSALGGVLNVLTKRPERKFRAEVSGAFGSFSEARGDFDLTGPLTSDGKLLIRVNGEIERSGTPFDFIDLDRNNIAGALTFSPSRSIEAHLSVEWQQRKTIGNPGLPIVGTVVSNGIAPIPRRRVLTEPAIAFLDASAPLVQTWVDVALADGWNLTPRLSFSRYDVDLSRFVVGAVQADRRTVGRSAFSQSERDRFWIGQLDLAGRVHLAGLTHQLLLGGEFADERRHIVFAQPASVPPIDALDPVYGRLPTTPYSVVLVARNALTSYAGYAQDLVEISSSIELLAGARYAAFETKAQVNGRVDPSSFGSFTWSAGGTWRLGRGISLFGGHSTGFDVENVIGARSATGKQFDPETSSQSEIGFRLRSVRSELTASVFQIERTNVLTADFAHPGFSVQSGRQRVRGLEVQGEWRPRRDLSITAGYALLDGKIVDSNDRNQGQAIANVPRHRANLFAILRPLDWLKIRAGANYVGNRRFSNIAAPLAPGLLATTIRLPDYATFDAGAQVRVGKLLIDLSMSNLLDAHYFQGPGAPQVVYPGDPFAATLRLTYRFGESESQNR